MGTVVVTNKNEEAYARKWDGELFSFPPGDPVTIPEAAAMYLFGYGGTDAVRAQILVRNGWQRNGVDTDPFGPVFAMKKLRNFIFKKGPEDAPKAKPEKKLAPMHQQGKREPGGINAFSPNAKDDGKTIVMRDIPKLGESSKTLKLPRKDGPLAPPAQAV